jgi:DNA-binding CsgD family transcriptional regulator/DNA-binding winged helix-turn-helix (wHTH) protein
MRANSYAKTSPGTSPAPGQQAKDRQRRLLVAGRGKLANDELVHRIFNWREVTVASRTKGLLGALKRLESGGIDLVLLNCECREEELELFVVAAQRRGFAGPILRVIRSTRKTPATSLQGGDSSSTYFDQRRATPEAQPSGESDATRGSPSFTQKERTVLMRVLEGWTSGQIARSLKRSEGSVKSSLQQIFKKLGVRKRSLIVRMAWEGNITGVPQRHPFASQAPPSPAILLAKQASRSAQSASQPIHAGDFVIDVHMRRAWVRGVEMQFSPKEFELLRCFSEHPDQLLRYENLLEMLWGNPAAARESLRVLIRALRTKVETTETPRYIVTQRNFGYRFIPSHVS